MPLAIGVLPMPGTPPPHHTIGLEVGENREHNVDQSEVRQIFQRERIVSDLPGQVREVPYERSRWLAMPALSIQGSNRAMENSCPPFVAEPTVGNQRRWRVPPS
eukprot:2252773-Amphidinium_carterae.1